jgi:Domain of unknown function (DUF362)
LCAAIPIHFVIADGIMAMEGSGPLNDTPRPLGRIVLADDPVAADATCARLMGFDPSRIVHVREGARFLGNTDPGHIDQVGETVTSHNPVPCGSRIRELLCPLKDENRQEAKNQWLRSRMRAMIRSRFRATKTSVLFLSLSSPSPASASSLPLAVRHHHPSVGLQSAVVVFLGTGLYSVLRFRYRQPLLKPLGWVVPRRIHAATALPSS